MSLKKLVGQHAAVRVLQDELSTGRIHHAYLFIGKEGVGKRTLALEFARALNCDNNRTDGCDSCLSCRKISHFNHPDLKLLEVGEGDSIKIEQIREMQQELAYKPLESAYKIYIIDQADLMTPQAANSLLKTLEEPPEYAVMILLANQVNYGKMLPTLLSRCQKIYLSVIPEQIIQEELEKRGLPQEKVSLLARLADGSLGQALNLADNQEFLALRYSLLEFLGNLPESSTVDIFQEVDRVSKLLSNPDFKAFSLFDLFVSWYRDLILLKQGLEDQLVNSDFIVQIKRQAEEYSLDQLLLILKMVNNMKGYINRNVRQDLALQVMFFKIRAKRV